MWVLGTARVMLGAAFIVLAALVMAVPATALAFAVPATALALEAPVTALVSGARSVDAGMGAVVGMCAVVGTGVLRGRDGVAPLSHAARAMAAGLDTWLPNLVSKLVPTTGAVATEVAATWQPDVTEVAATWQPDLAGSAGGSTGGDGEE